MSKANFTLIGFKELQAKLKKLDQEVRIKATRAALRRTAGIVVKAAKQNALTVDDKKTGRRIADNIRLQYGSKVFNRSGVHLYRIGVSTRWKNIVRGNKDEGVGGNTPHWHLVEFGTRRSREQQYMRPALRSNINNVLNRFARELNKEINKLV
jgi:HK97 gp10 family phage protein